jgi:fibronectin type 3 domain-containing protein
MVEQLIKDYKLEVEFMVTNDTTMNNQVTIEEGNNEGYYITIVNNGKEYTIRQHNYNEALKILGVMLKVINPNK